MNTFLKIHEADNAWVALRNLPAGHLIQCENSSFTLKEDIPAGHKFASQAIAKGNNIYKYGYPIGQALSDIQSGQHIHSHNLATNLSDNLTYKYQKEAINTDVSESNLTVNGYLRTDGRMGIRNELWIIPTVGCVNGIAQTMIDRLKKETDTNHIDDIRVYLTRKRDWLHWPNIPMPEACWC
ncbi:MAG: SAF domain-containing protein [Alistipes putredinis]